MSDFFMEMERVGARWIGKVIRSNRAKELGTPQRPIESAEAMLAAVRDAMVELDPTAFPAIEQVNPGGRQAAGRKRNPPPDAAAALAV